MLRLYELSVHCTNYVIFITFILIVAFVRFFVVLNRPVAVCRNFYIFGFGCEVGFD